MRYIYFIIGFIVGIIIDLFFTPSKKNTEGKYVSNLVIVNNTQSCNNKCTHIHHWMWGGLLIIYSAILLSPTHNISLFLFGLWLGSFISEYIQYGNNIFHVTQKCFTKCKS